MKYYRDIGRIDAETISLIHRKRNFPLSKEREKEVDRLIRSNEVLVMLYKKLQCG